jgi:catechol 2,3-dioxygenase-like lactoylglutathione lyase family enzyme
VGIICPDRAQVVALMSMLGLRAGSETYVAAYDADCIFSEGTGGCIEFIIPRGGKLKTFNKGAGGLHHVALEVDDLALESARLRAEGVQLLEESSVDAGDLLINFVPPSFTRGVIVELVQQKERKRASASEASTTLGQSRPHPAESRDPDHG